MPRIVSDWQRVLLLSLSFWMQVAGLLVLILVDAVRQRAFELNMSLIDLDRSLGDRKIFQQASGNAKVKHVHIDRAVKALGGRFVVQWNDE